MAYYEKSILERKSRFQKLSKAPQQSQNVNGCWSQNIIVSLEAI